MISTIPLSQKINISIAAIVYFLLCISFFLGALVLATWSPRLFFGFVVIIAIMAIPVVWLPRVLFKKSSRSSVLQHYFKTLLLLTLLLTSIAGLPFYYLAVRSEVAPLILPQAIISDGKKTVVFQGMVHVGSENFYKSVVYDLEEALDKGYKLYYEGITPSTDEANRWFSDTIAGGGQLSNHYRELAQICGVKFQLDYFQLMARDMQKHPAQHATVDVTTAELMDEYNRLLKTDSAFAQAIAAEQDKKTSAQDSSDVFAEKVLNYVQQGNEGQKSIVGAVCRGIFSIALKTSPDHAQPLDPVLLDFRNRHLAQQILADDNKTIYITYGAGHLPGVIKLLQAADPAWQLKSLKWLRGMATPDHLEGEL